jgi:hypothetical protein
LRIVVTGPASTPRWQHIVMVENAMSTSHTGRPYDRAIASIVSCATAAPAPVASWTSPTRSARSSTRRTRLSSATSGPVIAGSSVSRMVGASIARRRSALTGN